MQCLALVLSSLTKALSLTVASKKSHNGLHIAESTKFIRKNNGGKKTKQKARAKRSLTKDYSARSKQN